LKCSGNSKDTKLWTKKEIFLAFNQSAYKQWLGVEHLTWLVILVLTTTSTIKKGAVVWDNKFILAYGFSKIKGDSRTAKTDDRLELNLWGKRWRLVLLFSILKADGHWL
jgi:hypothetical protein